MTQTTIDAQALSEALPKAIAQAELDQYIEQQSFEIAPEFEIDSDEDKDFGALYRVWKGWELLGTFYQDLNGKWVAQPVGKEIKTRFETDSQAILVIIAVTGNLVVDTARD